MMSSNARLWALLLVLVVAFASPSVFAQDGEDAEEPETVEETEAEGDGEQAEVPAEEGDQAEGDEAEDEEEEDRESAHGSYEWKPSWGAGLEASIFFNDLDRWNRNLLEGEPQFDTNTIWNFDAAVEASFIEGTRLTVFGGYATPFHDEPDLGAWYVGLEPAFAFRRDMWEMALGLGVGLGAVDMTVEDRGADAGLVVLRPFLEVRRYLNTFSAVYLRGGFHQWLPYDVETDGLSFGDPALPSSSRELAEGGPYLALGVRFGSYPEHVKRVPDTDGDGLRDDVDDCPEKAEDFDDFEDDDGCPETDNDEDGIPDAEDQCPNNPEDLDGWQDDDGCPETDDDTDGDGILNADDDCPDKAEDKDGFEDEDGCPDPDNDEDGIADVDDECPNQAGVAEKNGCPLKRVVVTMKRIMINEKVFFEYNKAEIKEESHDLLNEVAQVLNENPRIKKLEVQGHTDHAGSQDYNQKLSQERAQSVRDYLVEQGVDEDRLTAKGYGFSQPLVAVEEGEEETEEAAAKNRRVEFVILEQEDIKKEVLENEIPEDAAEVEEADDADDADDAEQDDTE